MNRPLIARRVYFFVLAVLVPCVALLLFGVRFVQQERELARNRRADDETRLARDYARDLTEDLERAIQESLDSLDVYGGRSRRYPASNSILWLGHYGTGGFRAPWERPGGGAADHPILDPAFQSLIRRGTMLEYNGADLAEVIRAYDRAVAASRAPEQAAFARLRLAAILSRSGSETRATSIVAELLKEPTNRLDEYGIPLAYYAADRALEAGVSPDSVLAALRPDQSDSLWFAPERALMLIELTRTAHQLMGPGADSAQTVSPVLDRLIRESETLINVSVDVPAMVRLSPESGFAWRVFGPSDWMIATPRERSGDGHHVFAVRLTELPDRIPLPRRDGLVVTSLLTSAAAPATARRLGGDLPGLSVVIGGPGSVPGVGYGILFFSGLALILGVAVFGGFLLWRDIRREEEMVRLQGQFVSSVSHELRTPLTSIRLYAESMMIDDEMDAEERQASLSTIANESERLTRLLNNVLSASRIEQGTMTYARRPDSLQESVRSAVDAIRYVLEQSNARLNVDIEESIPDVLIDRDAVEQAVLNLLSNAIKYGGDSPVIHLRVHREGDQAIIEVSDNGPGIPPEHVRAIFERFYRAPMQPGRKIPGAGLGLALVRHIAEAHGGDVSVTSDPGSGATFRIEIPIDPTS